VRGIYEAERARRKSSAKRWRAKRQCLKLAMDSFLSVFVEERLNKPYQWSPQQINGHLKREMGIKCSGRAIYKFTESRRLEHLLFWGGTTTEEERSEDIGKRAKTAGNILERPERGGVGHYELDFIVSKETRWVLLVAVDQATKKASVIKLPNKKRNTIRAALSSMFRGIEVKSITTDNDIPFTCWRELEVLLNTPLYFTHPYHSWEKGLVENTNRWIRCFVPKRRDIGSVTEEELQDIHSFLNDRPRQCIEFRTPSEYY